MAGITKDTIFNLIPGDTTVSELVEQGNPPVDPKSAVEEGSPADAKKTLDLINEKVTRSEAHYLTSDSEGNPFPTKAALTGATAFYYAGESATPTKNDYCIVLADAQGKTSRWSFVGTFGEGGTWNRQYAINDTQFSEAQWNALNSGATADKIAEIDEAIKESNYERSVEFEDGMDNATSVEPTGVTVSSGGANRTTELRFRKILQKQKSGPSSSIEKTLVLPFKDGTVATVEDLELTPVATAWEFSGDVGEGVSYALTFSRTTYGQFWVMVATGAESWTEQIEGNLTDSVVVAVDHNVTAKRTIYGYQLGGNSQVQFTLDSLRSALGMTDAVRRSRSAQDDSGVDQTRALFTSENPVLAETTAGAVEDAAALDEDGVPASENLSALCSSANTVLGETIGARIAAAIGPVDDALDAALGGEVA